MRIKFNILWIVLGLVFVAWIIPKESLVVKYADETSLSKEDVSGPIKGLTVVAPPSPFGKEVMVEVSDYNAEWIAIVPYGYTLSGDPRVHFNSQRQWWGERIEGVIETIKLAKQQNLKIMLKPQVYVPGSWIGDLGFENDTEWGQWEEGYTAYIDTLLSISEAYEVDLFCIGTECKVSIQERTGYWRNLIQHARSKYSGLITYSSNWDSYNQVPFWDQLDFIGISAYFPLTETKTPQLNELQKKWSPIVKRLKKYSKRNNKKILFTEFGYLSIDGCAYRAWELEKQISERSINEQAQANAIHGLFESFWDESFWAGGFLWKWFPNGMGHEGYPQKDYTPQGKVSEQTIKNWYDKK